MDDLLGSFRWYDALCVNQQDPEERSSQVNRMADIYSKATRAAARLGPQSHDSALALECIETASSNIRCKLAKFDDGTTAC